MAEVRAGLDNHMPSKRWDGITYPFPRFTIDVITYPCFN